MDRLSVLLEHAHPCYLLLGNFETGDFTVMAFPGGPVPENYFSRGLQVMGAAGIVDGKPATAILHPLDPLTVDALASQISARLDTHIGRLLANPEIAERAEAAAFSAFMQHLISLPAQR